MGWSPANLRHVAALVKQRGRAAETVYDSIGADLPLALAPGWLNLGLWEDLSGPLEEAPIAVRRLVADLAADLPTGGSILDVGNGLAAQDPVIAEIAEPALLVPVNITRSQLIAGRERLAQAGARAVRGDASQMPFADDSFDGVISVEAAFHFPSRRRFFDEAFRVLRPGGVLTMSDVPVQRLPRGPIELAAGIVQLRFWGLHAGSASSSTAIRALAHSAGFEDVRVDLCGDRVIDPALRFVRRRLPTVTGLTPFQQVAVRNLVGQVGLLRRRGILDYLILRGKKPRTAGR